MGKREKIKSMIREKVLRFDEDNKEIILLLLNFFLSIFRLFLKYMKTKNMKCFIQTLIFKGINLCFIR